MNKLSNEKRAQRVVALCGAAATTMYMSPSAEATVIDLTSSSFTPSQANWTSASTLRNVSIVEGSANIGGFSIWNDSIGKSFSFNGGFASWAIAAAGSVLNTSNFSGTSSGFYFTKGATGEVFLGFRATDANGGGVGWFSADLGGPQGDVVFAPTGGQYGDDSESVIVGAGSGPGPVVSAPEPASLGLLALGALAAGAATRRRKAPRHSTAS